MPVQLYSAPMKYKDQNGDYQNIIGISGNPGRGITSVVLNNDYTLTINFTDNTSTTTGSIRGNGIASIEKTSTAGVVDTYTITDSDGGTSTFTIENGVTPSLSIGTVIEGQAAAATITGTADAPVLNLVLPAANLSTKADKADTVLDTTLSCGRKDNTTVGTGSFAFGNNVEASGLYSHAIGNSTVARGNGAHSEGGLTYANGLCSHTEGIGNIASGSAAHAEGGRMGDGNIAVGVASHAEGIGTLAEGDASHAAGMYNIEDSHASWVEWVANTEYAVGDKVKVTNSTTVTGYICKTANSDTTFDASHWTIDTYMNFAEIIGNGATDNARSNAYALDWDGNGHFKGNVYVGANADSSGGVKLVSQTDYADANTGGVVKVDGTKGLAMNTAGFIVTIPAPSSYIKAGTEQYYMISPKRQHESVFYGLAKAAGQDMASSANAVGTYTPGAKAAIQQMLGISNLLAPTETTTASKAYSIGEVFTSNGKLYKATAAIAAADAIVTQDAGETVSGSNAAEVKLSEYAVRDVQVNGASILQDGVANVPVASLSVHGVTRYASSLEIKSGNGTGRTIYPAVQHTSTFYGLAKAAGADMKDIASTTVGTYPDAQKAAIQHMLGTDTNLAPYEADTTADTAYAIGELFMLNGKLHQATSAIAVGDTLTVGTNCAVVNASEVFPHDVQVNGTSVVSNGVANVPTATANRLGVVRAGMGLQMASDGECIAIKYATDAGIKNVSQTYQVITPINQHTSVFYGLAKASGDTTQSASSNAVGVYTDSAKASIKSMLGIVDGSTGTVDVSSTTPTITAVENTRYVCGEVSTLSFTPPASGISIVRFTSGTTATVLTLPSTVKFPEWFDATALEANTIYELCITDGIYGAVMSWAL